MDQDIQELAESKLDSLLSGDNQAENEADNTAQEDNTNTDTQESEENKGEAQNQTGDGEQTSESDGEGEKETNDEENNDSQDEAEEKEPEAQGLSDDELLAELEKRGLKVAKKDEDDKKSDEPRQPQQWEKRPSEVPEDTWNDMPPANKYIYNSLPYITAVGKDGETVRIKTPEQLPDDFEFANKKAESQFISEVTAQSSRAEKIADELHQYSQRRQQQTQQQQESQRVVADVERLQKDGIVPKFTTKPGTPEFDNDEGVKVANEILKLRDEINADGNEKISVYRAGHIYKGMHPELYQKKQTVAKGDTERKKAAAKISGSPGGENKSSKTTQRRRFPLGTSARDIVDMYEQDLD